MLCFIHGMAGNSRNWETQYAQFGDRYRVIGWDAPGYGGSDDWPTEDPAVSDYVSMIVCLLNALGVRTAHMVGHSFGGTLIPAVQKVQPERVASMVLAQPVIGSGSLGAVKQADIIAAREYLLAELGVEAYAKHHAPRSVAASAGAATVKKGIEVTSWTRPKGYMAQWRAMARADIFQEIGEALCPATVIAGTGDKTASQEVVKRIAAAISGAHFVELRDVGHMIYLEHPDRFNRALADHLAQA